MSKAIEDALGLPRLEDALKGVTEGSEEPVDPRVEAMAVALQNVNPEALVAKDPLGTGDHVLETNEIYDTAMRAYKDLLDLGFNIEAKHAGANAFQPALKALEIALKASQSKASRKIERIKTIIDQERHDREMNDGVEDGEIIENGGQSITANRNDLMARIRKGEI